ncbi:MAG: glutamyl-tRNA reductase, partial [Chloroflexi bacterium]|nr:glutamyl-tRNA reductase [Chloroflexota bacterium]
AARHLFRVASGLDSMILGEAQILGQVRESYATAISNGGARGLISKVFHHALRVGKRARHETRIGENALSIGSAAVEMARHTLGDIRQSRVMVIGAGEAGKLVSRAMKDRGIGKLLVVNRTLKRAQELALELEGEAASFDDLETLLGSVDIVVSSTDSQDVVLTRNLVARAAAQRNGSPLLIVDIAIPRDADPAIGQVPGVSLLDMDDLEAISQANRQAREKEATRVEEIIEDEVVRFREWWNSLRVAPSIAQLKGHAELLRQGELRKTLKKMPHLPAEDVARIEMLSKALVKKLLHSPIANIKENPAYMETAQHLFGLDGKEQ